MPERLNTIELFKETFEKVVKQATQGPLHFITDAHVTLSKELDQAKVQSSSTARLYKLAISIASYLVDEKGAVPFDKLDEVIKGLEENLYFIGPDREKDSKGREHQLKALKQLKESKELGRLLSGIDKPDNHPVAERLLRETVKVKEGDPLTKRDAVVAALSAWLTPLRQNVGSCFATAPAILIQQEHPQYLLKDLFELLGTGRLTRTFGGKSFQVPISSSFGVGDLNRQVLLVKSAPRPYLDLSLSPGIKEACIKMGIIEKKEELYPALEASLSPLFKESGEIILTIEQVLERLLMEKLHITSKDLEDYAQRPRLMVFSSIVVTKEQKNSCAHYEHLLSLGKASFVSLTENPLLKAWEFSMASFAETRADFATWNLYSSLGLDPREEGGIGQTMSRQISTQLEEKNRRVADLQEEYKMVYHQLMLAEGRLKSASSEDQARWIRADYQVKRNEFNSLEEMRDKEHYIAERLANLYNELTDFFISLFPNYFQEVYDPDLHDVSVGPYDDTPAGFRLLYKHGRTNTSAWTFVHNYGEFIYALDQFFIACEREIEISENFQGLEKQIGEIITGICIQIKSPEFIDTAFKRMAAHHRTPFIVNPLDNLSKIQKKPWAYTSGGGMATLVHHYFCLDSPPKETSRWVESPQELLLFFVDTIKLLPQKETERFLKDDRHSLLIHSPTHAFRLLPGLSPFKELWQRKEFTYTLVRDEFINPQKAFYQHLRLDGEMIQDLVQTLKQNLPQSLHEAYDSLFNSFATSLLPREFRDHFMDTIRRDPQLRTYGPHFLNKDLIDSLLYKNIPYIHGYRLEEVLKELLPNHKEEISSTVSRFDLFSSEDLLRICSTLLLQSKGKATFSDNIHYSLIQKMRQMGLLPPSPILFADTNWEGDYFSFVVSPSSMELELWRMNSLGKNGAPMSSWKEWLDGSRKKPDWGIYTQPEQYS